MDNALLYAQSNGLQKRDALLVLREFLPQMDWSEEEETVLDVGCGSGDVTKTVLLPLLPKNVTKVVGVDMSKEMVDFASKHFDHNIVEYQQLDIISTSNPRQKFPEGFTKLTSFYCLHWISNQETCLKNMYNLLQAGGEALLVFLSSNPIFTMYERISQKGKWSKFMKDVSNYIPVYQYKEKPEECMRTYAEDAGFDIAFCGAPEMTFPFKNMNYLRSAIAAVNPFVNRIPTEDRDEFLNDCLQELTTLCPPDAFGEVEANYRLMVAVLRKPFADDEEYY